jgi:hypothetical protein
MTTQHNHVENLMETLTAAGCTSQQVHAFMLTLVYVNCAQCGSTRETVLRDRELNPDAVCCETGPAAVPCYFCGTVATPQVGTGKRAFCSKACWSDYGE